MFTKKWMHKNQPASHPTQKNSVETLSAPKKHATKSDKYIKILHNSKFGNKFTNFTIIYSIFLFDLRIHCSQISFGCCNLTKSEKQRQNLKQKQANAKDWEKKYSFCFISTVKTTRLKKKELLGQNVFNK